MVDLGFLSPLAEWWFVVPWYVVGSAGAIWALTDMYTVNTPVSEGQKWAWPIIIFFFSVIGLAFYLLTARAPGIGEVEGDEARERHREFMSSMFNRTTASVIHCVGGDGLGVVTAMIFARIVGLGFWGEFWLEYAVGFAFGWFIFQYKSQKMHARSKPHAIWRAARAEWFSMITVMAGMGLVMGFATPLTVGEQPTPNTFAFWGFASLGLLVGYLLTYPMNWMLIKIEYKHGM